MIFHSNLQLIHNLRQGISCVNWAVLCYWYQAVFVKMMPNRLTVFQLLFISVTFPRANCVYNNEMPFEGYVCDTTVLMWISNLVPLSLCSVFWS